MESGPRPGIDYPGVTTPFYCHDGEGNFVFHQRSEQCRDEVGAWDPGSGKLEVGLSINANVLKEVSEEYTCEGEITGEIPAHDIFREHDGLRTHWIALPRFVRVDREVVAIGEPHKMTALQWTRLDQLPTPLHTGFRHTFESYPSYFAPYIQEGVTHGQS